MGNFIDEFRNSEIAQKMGKTLASYKGDKVTIMEVCGTHTMAISKFGIRDLLPENIKLISGPGCPVCVTPSFFINAAIDLARKQEVIITTFGDMMRIPSNKSTLLHEKAKGSDIRIVYSPLDAVRIAAQHPNKKVVFLSVGFETTTPICALAILKAKEEGLKNFFLLSANKTIPAALKLLAEDKEIGVNGFLYPGNVSVIIGTNLYKELADNYKIPGVVTGFEPLDMLHAIISLVSNINQNKNVLDNQYQRVVSDDGNKIALEKMYEVFQPFDAVWRGIGLIPGSGLSIKQEYSELDAWKVFKLPLLNADEPKGCLCGEVLKGKKNPKDCSLFRRGCTPETPIGSCMVSGEGTCAAYYRYNV